MIINPELAIVALECACLVEDESIDTVKRAINYYEFLTGGGSEWFKKEKDMLEKSDHDRKKELEIFITTIHKNMDKD